MPLHGANGFPLGPGDLAEFALFESAQMPCRDCGVVAVEDQIIPSAPEAVGEVVTVPGIPPKIEIPQSIVEAAVLLPPPPPPPTPVEPQFGPIGQVITEPIRPPPLRAPSLGPTGVLPCC